MEKKDQCPHAQRTMRETCVAVAQISPSPSPFGRNPIDEVSTSFSNRIHKRLTRVPPHCNSQFVSLLAIAA